MDQFDRVEFINTALKVCKYGVISGSNTGKYGPEKNPYLDSFHIVSGWGSEEAAQWWRRPFSHILLKYATNMLQ